MFGNWPPTTISRIIIFPSAIMGGIAFLQFFSIFTITITPVMQNPLIMHEQLSCHLEIPSAMWQLRTGHPQPAMDVSLGLLPIHLILVWPTGRPGAQYHSEKELMQSQGHA